METEQEKPEKPKKSGWPLKKLAVSLGAGVAAIVLLGALYVYAASPAAIRNPKMDHLHFRMQIIVDGQAVDFAAEPFQTPYEKDQCSADLTKQPIHFHDHKGQFVHVHWAGITGGVVLKNYGWNLIGGAPNVLGYRLDSLPRVKSVPIHGKNLPAAPSGDQYWVYTGDETGYRKRSINDFKNQKLEKFFDRESNFPGAQSGFIDWLFPKAVAHGTEVHADSTGAETEDERLTRINNLIGNVVIFVQKDEPSAAQIKDRFAHLEPLSDSTCGG